MTATTHRPLTVSTTAVVGSNGQPSSPRLSGSSILPSPKSRVGPSKGKVLHATYISRTSGTSSAGSSAVFSEHISAERPRIGPASSAVRVKLEGRLVSKL
jgi:hypothetical protein